MNVENPLSFENFAKTCAAKLAEGGKAAAEAYASDVQRNVAWDKAKLLARAVAIAAQDAP